MIIILLFISPSHTVIPWVSWYELIPWDDQPHPIPSHPTKPHPIPWVPWDSHSHGKSGKVSWNSHNIDRPFCDELNRNRTNLMRYSCSAPPTTPTTNFQFPGKPGSKDNFCPPNFCPPPHKKSKTMTRCVELLTHLREISGSKAPILRPLIENFRGGGDFLGTLYTVGLTSEALIICQFTMFEVVGNCVHFRPIKKEL